MVAGLWLGLTLEVEVEFELKLELEFDVEFVFGVTRDDGVETEVSVTVESSFVAKIDRMIDVAVPISDPKKNILAGPLRGQQLRLCKGEDHKM